MVSYGPGPGGSSYPMRYPLLMCFICAARPFFSRRLRYAAISKIEKSVTGGHPHGN